MRQRDTVSSIEHLFTPPGSKVLPSKNTEVTEVVVTSHPRVLETIPNQTVSATPTSTSTPTTTHVPTQIPVTESIGTQGQIRTGQTSRNTFFDTFFDEFSLSCTPVYRKYTPDERYNDKAPPESFDPSESPRFIRISWKTAPKLANNTANDAPRLPSDSTPDFLDDSFSEIAGISEPGGRSTPVSFANESLNPGSLFVHVTSHDGNRDRYIPPIDVEAPLISPKHAGVDVSELISNSDPLRESGVQIDSLGTRAVSSTAPDRFSIFRLPVKSTGENRSNAILIGQAALGVLASPVSFTDTREHTEASLITSTFSTEIGLMDALDDQVTEASVDAPSHETSQVNPSLTYTGYVIERQRLGSDGVFVNDRRFVIAGSDRGAFTDHGISYGVVYRYRISSIVKWVHSSELRVAGLSSDVAQQSNPTVNGQMTLRYMRSSWSPYVNVVVLDTDLPSPPKQLTVLHDRKMSGIRISWVLPENVQEDISYLSLYRRTMLNGVFTSDWKRIASDIPMRNGLYLDRDDIPAYPGQVVYAMTSTSIHGQVSDLSEQIFYQSARGKGEGATGIVSFPGAPLKSYGNFSVMPVRFKDEDLVCENSITVSPRVGPSSYMNIDADYVLRVQSIETGQFTDILLSLAYRNFAAPVGQANPPRIAETSVLAE